MYRVNGIKIGGFRRLSALELPMRPFMVMIGANGVGKSSFLDAYSILSASAAGRLNSTLSSFGGISQILTRNGSTNLHLSVDMEVPGDYKPLKYDLLLAQRGLGYSISHETLSQDRGQTTPFKHIDSDDGNIRFYEAEKGLIHPNWEYNSEETSLAQVPKMFSQPEELRRILATVTHYHTLDVGPRSPVKTPQLMKPANLPGVNGEDLIPLLYSLQQTNSSRFDSIIDAIHTAFPDFEELNFPPVAAGTMSMTWKDKHFDKPIYVHELSEGVLRFLWLVALLQSPGLSAVTMIDEPEISLHPELLGLLAELMREASTRTQLIVATHSDRFVRFLKPNEVVVLDVDDLGCTNAKWADTVRLLKPLER